MFGEIGPRLKGGFNDLISYFKGTTTTLKPVTGQDFQISAGDLLPTPITSFSTIGGPGRSLSLNASNAVGTGQNGGAVNITAGATDPATTTGTGGAVNITAGSANSATGGTVSVLGGNGTNGGHVLIKSGTGLTVNTGGQVNIQTPLQGALNITNLSNAGGSDGASAGGINITSGSTNDAGAPGNVTITAGSNTASGLAYNKSGGSVTINGGSGGYQNSTGGGVNLVGGTGKGTGNGADIRLTPGTAAGTGAAGNIVLNGGNGSALSTSAAGGFVEIPTMAGAPTGTPANIAANTVPLVFDTTNNKLWIYTGGAWKGAVFS